MVGLVDRLSAKVRRDRRAAPHSEDRAAARSRTAEALRLQLQAARRAVRAEPAVQAHRRRSRRDHRSARSGAALAARAALKPREQSFVARRSFDSWPRRADEHWSPARRAGSARRSRALSARAATRLVLVARRRERLEKLAAELGGEPHAVVEPCDLAQDRRRRVARVVRLAERAARGRRCRELRGRGAHRPLSPTSRATVVRAMCDVNVRALVELTRRFLPPMLERRRGFVINVASNAAFQPIPFLAVYAATKVLRTFPSPRQLADEVRGHGSPRPGVVPGDHVHGVPGRRPRRAPSSRCAACRR